MDSTLPPHHAPASDPRSRHRHGRWTFRCDADEISEIALDGIELLDSARPALRDAQWETVPPQVTSESWADGADGADGSGRPGDRDVLERTLAVRYDGETGAARATCTLTVSASELRLRLVLTAEDEVITNRAGLTAMLPREMAGQDAVLTTVDGHHRDVRLPLQIAPWQPLFGIRALTLSPAGVRARLELTGDEFEMEDQRNWTDASFKIYSRPLERPFPYRIPAGTEVVQELVLTALDAPADAARADADATVTDLRPLLEAAAEVPLPGIGIGATTAHGAALTAPQPGLEGLDHLVVEVSDRFPLEPVLESARAEAGAEELPVDLRISGADDVDVAGILDRAEEAGLVVVRAAVFDEAAHVTTPELWERLVGAVAGRGIEPVAGARSHFTELNRQIAMIPEAEHLAFPSTPQMHMRETWHVARGLAALGDVLASARELRPRSRLLLGPVTLRPRVNAVATDPELVDRADEHGYGAHLTPGSVDPRQHTPWAGAWAAAVIAEAAVGGAESVSLMEMAGPRGVVTPAEEPGVEGALAGGPGAEGLSPAGRVIARLAPMRGRLVRVLRSPGGPGTAVLALDGLLLLVNAGLEDWAVRGPQGEELVVAPGTVHELG